MYKKNKNRSKKYIIFALVLLLILALVIGYFVFNDTENNVGSEQETSKVNQVDYSPPTDDEKNAVEDQKDSIIENQQTQPSSTSEARIVIVDASQYNQDIEVRAFVENIIKDGTCEIKFTSGNNSIIKTVPAYGDASTTPCITLTLPRSEFPNSGNWSVKVTYNSNSGGISGSAEGIINIE